ncbi:MAG TPA: hypothetical protein VFL90_06315 [Methylomirabilota bacterium]|nr:hypothetical protein [Methylomirabilota bacterium]
MRVECPDCGGTGATDRDEDDPVRGHHTEEEGCSTCNGTGQVDSLCSVCGERSEEPVCTACREGV